MTNYFHAVLANVQNLMCCGSLRKLCGSFCGSCKNVVILSCVAEACGRLRKGFCGSIFFSKLLFFIGVFSKFTRKGQIFVHQEVDNVIKIVLYFIEFAEGRTISLNKFMAGCHRSNSHCVSAFSSISH